MEAVKIILIVLEVIASLAMILIVLFQSNKEAGLGAAFTGNADSYLNKNQLTTWDKKLTAWTKWVALAWLLITFGLCLAI